MAATTIRDRTSAIRFEAQVLTLGEHAILRLPREASEKLPSRGQVAVEGTIDGHLFDTVLEPDGEFGHWLRLEGRSGRWAAGATAAVEIRPVPRWPEPQLPEDLEAALAAAPEYIQAIWKAITPMARWEWVRWVNATRNPDTRRRRIEVSMAKMKNGKRRPCCFNLAACTDPDLSRNGKLLDLL